MSDCCSPIGVNYLMDKFFSRLSKRYAKRFRKSGLDKTQRYILEGVRKEPVATKKILDIGCGVGSLHLTLLQEGAAAAVGVDVSEGMIRQAKRLSGDLHFEQKTDYRVGDFVAEAFTLKDADITLLDKVVCCYEDYPALLESSMAKTRSIYALSHPRDNFLVEFVFKLQIFCAKLFRWGFHPFWHDWKELRERIVAKGFELIYSNSTLSWDVLVFRRIRR